MTWLWGWLGLQYARTAVLQYDCLEANIETKMLSNVQMWAWNWNKISNIFDSWINGRKDSPDSVTSVNANLYKGGYFWPSPCLLILYWMMMSSKCLSSENYIQKFLDRFMILSEAVKKVYQLKLLESDNVESLQEEDVTHYIQNMHLLASNFVWIMWWVY